MQQLHLVGFTTDLEGLIFSTRRGAKSGGFLVVLDDQLLDSIRDALRLRDDHGAGPLEPAVEPEEDEEVPVRRRARPHSELSPREIQGRLRSGSTVAEVAQDAGVDEEWVLRFAAPILAEQARVVEQAQQLTFVKARLGPSSRPLGDSVRWNLADRGIELSDEEYDEGWDAFNVQGTTWVVRYVFVSRRRRQTAEWNLDLRGSELTARNRLASDLAYVEPGRKRHGEGSGGEAPSRRSAGKATAQKAGAKKSAARKAGAKKAAARKAGATKSSPRKAAARKSGARKAGAKKAGKSGEGGRAGAGSAVTPPAATRPSHLARPPSPMNRTNRMAGESLAGAGRSVSRPTAPAAPVFPSAPSGPPRSEPLPWAGAGPAGPVRPQPGEGDDLRRPSEAPRRPPRRQAEAPPPPQPQPAPAPPEPVPAPATTSADDTGDTGDAIPLPPPLPPEPPAPLRRPRRASAPSPPAPPPVAPRRPSARDADGGERQPSGVVILPSPDHPRPDGGEDASDAAVPVRPAGEQPAPPAPGAGRVRSSVRIRADLAEAGSAPPAEEGAEEDVPEEPQQPEPAAVGDETARTRRSERRRRSSRAG